MLDKYGVGQDPYCYPGSSTLRNRLHLLDEARLHQAERELSEIAVDNLPLFPPPYDLDRLSPDTQASAKDIQSAAHQRIRAASD